MAESDCIDEFAKRMRPMTANEVIAIRRNKLCSNKHERHMKHMRRANTQNVNRLIKSQFSIEYSLSDIQSNTETSFGKNDGFGHNYTRPPSYLENYLSLVKLDKKLTPEEEIKKPQLKQFDNIPFVRPYSALSKLRSTPSRTGCYSTPTPSSINPKGSLSARRVQSAMSKGRIHSRPFTAPSHLSNNKSLVSKETTSGFIDKIELANKPQPVIIVKREVSKPVTKMTTKSNNMLGMQIEDERLKKKYLAICRERDAIPKHSHEKKELLKTLDPVFAKRYREFKVSVQAGQVPKFSYADHNLTHAVQMIPKKMLDRQRKGIVSLLDSDRMREPKKIMHTERNEHDRRVKLFIRRLETDQFNDFDSD